MRWFDTVLCLLLVISVRAIQYPGSGCVDVILPPPATLQYGCEWVVRLSSDGCRQYEEVCGKPSNCKTNEVLWECSLQCSPICGEQARECIEQCGPPKCDCYGGFAWDGLGNCIDKTFCPAERPQCEDHEEFKECSSRCESTCYTPSNVPCSSGCAPPRCQCVQGYVRHGHSCIPMEQCPANLPPMQECDASEVFVECSSMCEPTCTSDPIAPCPAACGPPKCECRRGLVRSNGLCIAKSQCPPPIYRCPVNEDFKECSTMCEATCETPNPKCNKMCGPPKCQCKYGFVRKSGQCIPSNQCPSTDPDGQCGDNEQFVTCSSMCEPTCTSQPNQPCSLRCGPPKCQCKQGFVRENGRCIARNQCSSTDPEGQCGANEQFVTCSTTCEPTCENQTPLCNKMCGPPKCQCKHGFVRKSGQCIPRNQCPSTDPEGQCGTNEQFVSCSSMCEPTCSSSPFEPCSLRCGPPKCQCKQGFVRKSGQCIPRNQCPSTDPEGQCGANEQFVTCSTTCEPTCENKTPVCNYMCGPPKCQCKEGFVRKSGQCIPSNQCPSTDPEGQCGANEQFMTCSSMCEPTCTSQPNQPCPLMCGPPKCQCKGGFVRDNGQCIRRNQCPSTDPEGQCGANEQFVTCSTTCEPTCENKTPVCNYMCGPPKCQCKEGFVRKSGQCIPSNQCPSTDPEGQCGANEQFKSCSSMCEPTCDSPPNQPCVLSCGPPKCQCKQGFVRENGRCIPRYQCPVTMCGANEQFMGCSTTCEPTCENQTPVCNKMCGSPKCQCMPGFVRDNGQCIRRDQCPSTDPEGQCGANEQFVTCSTTCEPTCENKTPICNMMCGPPKCQCKHGFVRQNGRCIRQNQCPSTDPEGQCGVNEQFMSCSSMCEPTCSSSPNEPCPAMCGPPKCQCKPGFVRENGRCIPRNRCPTDPEGQCGANEQFVTCSTTCEPTCENKTPICNKMCGPPKCQCKQGFVRRNGQCIPHTQCPSTDPEGQCGANEHFMTCSSMCEPTCDSPPNQPCVLSCGPPKCQCKQGFVRENGRCIPRYQCPVTMCGVNEQFMACSTTCEPTCENQTPICNKMCGSPKCQCMPGFVRENGQCIRRDQCPSTDPEGQCGANEQFMTCSSMCEPTCSSSLDEPCSAMCGPPKCQCKQGFVRDNGRCIHRNQCPSTDPEGQCGANEQFVTCSTTCEPTCENKTPICNMMCGPPKCQCKQGFVRENGRCIPHNQCPSTDPEGQCGANEQFMTCSSMCEPTCSSSPYEPCSLRCGPPKCQCKQGFVRENGQCIRRNQCPSTDPEGQCGANEQFMSCSSMCEPTCDSLPNQPCILSCGPPKCQCKPGFVRKSGQCIPRNQCPSTDPEGQCGANEKFMSCSSMCEPTCSSSPNEPCAAMCGPPKCQCKEGFVRENGQCIPRNQCPSTDPEGQCGANEQFMTCSSMCEPTCDSPPNQPCVLSCGPPKCQCKQGFVRENGRCIPRYQCPVTMCGVNEQFVGCSTTCEPTCKSPVPVCNKMCGPPKCQCMPGFVRENGQCIPVAQCKSSVCGRNELYVQCSTMCEPTCRDPNPACIEMCGPPKCQCKNGFVRRNGRCIKRWRCGREDSDSDED